MDLIEKWVLRGWEKLKKNWTKIDQEVQNGELFADGGFPPSL